MTKTLLAIDDSATMRKVFEITFQGTELRVMTANAAASGLTCVREQLPDVVLIDTTIENHDGYALCKEVRKLAPAATILMLSSRFHPYDAARGDAAGADDYLDKPFETQAAVEKVQKALISRAEGALVALPVVSLQVMNQAMANDTMVGELAGLGLSQSQVESVMTLSREMIEKAIEKTIEKIAWEVVPPLAEALIREEIARLMRADGANDSAPT